MEHRISVFAGPASSHLGAAVCDVLQVPAGLYECRRFPDGEVQIDLHESVRGRDVYLLQSTSPPPSSHTSGTPGRIVDRDVARSARASRQASSTPSDSTG
jgi:ribose-phosphate pyrophosphokinase